MPSSWSAPSSSRIHAGKSRCEFFLLIAALGLTATTAPSCSRDSNLKVTLLAANNEITDVSRVVVLVRDEQTAASAWLEYTPSKPISFDTMTSKTFSIAFTPGQWGTVLLDVGVLDGSSACLGRGMASALIKQGDVTAVIVSIAQTKACPTAPDAGAGASDVGSDTNGNAGTVTFPGCDPANAGAMCPGNQTCFVNCIASKAMCIAAGARGPGEACTVNTDCVSGTQCFDYSGLPGCGAGTKICQKFCNSDAQCDASAGTGAGGSAGGTGGQAVITTGVAATCRNPVVCSANVTTSSKTCSFACDPRGNATLGCPKGLSCFLYKDLSNNQDSPDCGCREPSRTGTDGMTCLSSTNCAPGYVCNTMGTTQVCRKLCQMTSPTDCTAPKTCSPLTNTAFGVCIGS